MNIIGDTGTRFLQSAFNQRDGKMQVFNEIVLLRRGGCARLRITGGLVRRRIGVSHPDARQEASG